MPATDLESAAHVATARYVRLHAAYIGRVGAPVGIFVAVDHLRRADLLSLAEEDVYFDVDDWFNEHVPNPPFYEDGNSVGAITWFKTAVSNDLIARLRPLCFILDSHHVMWTESCTDDPGEVVYEDAFQVGAIPRERLAPTPVPHGRTMTESTGASKRHLGKRRRDLASDDSVKVRGPRHQ